MGFIDDPDQFEDFPEDPDDYESEGYQYLDADKRFIIELFQNSGIEIEDEYVEQLIEDLIVNEKLHQFALDMQDYSDFFLPIENIPKNSFRENPFAFAVDAWNYLEGIPGWEGFAGLTWQNGVWHVWIGDTI